MNDIQKEPFRVGQLVWGFAGDMYEIQKNHTYHDVVSVVVSGISHDGNYVILSSGKGYPVNISLLFHTEASAREHLESSKIIEGDFVCGRGTQINESGKRASWYRDDDVISGVVIKENKASIDIFDPTNNTTYRCNRGKCILISRGKSKNVG